MAVRNSSVSIGLQNGTHTQITEGLNAEQRVIVYPSDTLKPGSAVKPTN